jgi:hypothetical protein
VGGVLVSAFGRTASDTGENNDSFGPRTRRSTIESLFAMSDWADNEFLQPPGGWGTSSSNGGGGGGDRGGGGGKRGGVAGSAAGQGRAGGVGGVGGGGSSYTTGSTPSSANTNAPSSSATSGRASLNNPARETAYYGMGASSNTRGGFFSKFYVKLAAVPVVLFLIRIWSSLRIILYFSGYHTLGSDAFLEGMQAFFDPSQGFFNALLFVLASPEDRASMLQLFRRMLVAAGRGLCTLWRWLRCVGRTADTRHLSQEMRATEVNNPLPASGETDTAAAAAAAGSQISGEDVKFTRKVPNQTFFSSAELLADVAPKPKSLLPSAVAPPEGSVGGAGGAVGAVGVTATGGAAAPHTTSSSSSLFVPGPVAINKINSTPTGGTVGTNTPNYNNNASASVSSGTFRMTSMAFSPPTGGYLTKTSNINDADRERVKSTDTGRSSISLGFLEAGGEEYECDSESRMSEFSFDGTGAGAAAGAGADA